jgi:hypothetical protein
MPSTWREPGPAWSSASGSRRDTEQGPTALLDCEGETSTVGSRRSYRGGSRAPSRAAGAGGVQPAPTSDGPVSSSSPRRTDRSVNAGGLECSPRARRTLLQTSRTTRELCRLHPPRRSCGRDPIVVVGVLRTGVRPRRRRSRAADPHASSRLAPLISVPGACRRRPAVLEAQRLACWRGSWELRRRTRSGGDYIPAARRGDAPRVRSRTFVRRGPGDPRGSVTRARARSSSASARSWSNDRLVAAAAVAIGGRRTRGSRREGLGAGGRSPRLPRPPRPPASRRVGRLKGRTDPLHHSAAGVRRRWKRWGWAGIENESCPACATFNSRLPGLPAIPPITDAGRGGTADGA